MSTFAGWVPELENVLIDNFLSHKSYTCFFLSHCHADHMSGLDRLFSEIHKRYKLEDETVIKEVTSTVVITVPENNNSPEYQMTVTTIPAGHCPGSVMFLFETVNQTILYTGDFRIMTHDIRKFKQFHNKTQIKAIDKIYLDATFLNEIYWHFPSRSEAIHELISLIKNWTSQSLNHNVILETSATYGYEFVFVEVARKLECKIHVKDSLHNLFSNIPEIGFALTKDCNETKVHAYGLTSSKCSPCENEKLLKIRLSAQWYKSPKGADVKEPVWKEMSKQRIMVCFSTHCSCSELVNFLQYLKPKCVVPCTTTVGTSKEDTNAYVQQLIYSWTVNPRQSPDSVKANFSLERNYRIKIKFPKFEQQEEFFEEKKIRLGNKNGTFL